MDFVHYFEGGERATHPHVFVAGSDIVGEITPPAAESIVAAMRALPNAGSATAIVESLSGAVSDLDPCDAAFPWRRQAASIQWYTKPQSPNIAGAANKWLVEAHDAIRAYSVGGYVNYLEPDSTAAQYFGGNLSRLNAVGQKYDPHGVMYSGINAAEPCPALRT
jgi:Berberine and berberine like